MGRVEPAPPDVTFGVELLDALPSHVAVLDERGVIVAANARWRAFADENGAPPGVHAWIGANYLAVCDRASNDRAAAASATACAAGIRAVLSGASDEFQMEYPCHSSAEPRWFRMRAAPLGSPRRGGLVVHEDITALRVSEQERTSLRAQPHATVDGLPVMVAYWDADRRCRFANKAHEHWFGVSADRMIGMRLEEFLRSTWASSEPYVEGALRGEPQEFEREIPDPAGGARRWIQVRYIPDLVDAKMLGFGVLVNDVTRLKRTEMELRKSEERLRSLVDSAADGICSINHLGIIERANASLERMFGYAQGELALANVKILMPPADADRHDEHLAAYAAGGPKHVVGASREVIARRKDGTLFVVDLSVSEFEQAGAKIFTGILRDVTARKHAQAELVRLKEAAESASRVKGQFLANMSHEIRTPMNGVVGMIDLLSGTPLNEEQREYADAARSSGEALLSVLNAILDLSKIESGKLVLEAIAFDLAATIQEVAHSFALAASRRGVKIVVVCPEGLPRVVVGDAGRTRQVLINLIGNAVKFTDRGTIAVTVELLEASPRTAGLRISVKDTGIGIPSDKVAGLFQPFVQADGATTRKFGGTGLGLSISKQLVEMMGGTIGVRSQAGEGSTFWFALTLPVGSARPPAPSADAPRARDGDALVGAGKRVLLVEDNVINQKIASKMLRKLGFDVDVASGGREGIARAEASAYDLVFMDCQMPELDGYETTQILRREGLTAAPIVALTAHAMEGDREKCLQAGMNDYLSKPVTSDMLHAVVKRWLPTSCR